MKLKIYRYLREWLNSTPIEVRTFYWYFPSKNSVIIALAQEMLESVLVAVRKETEGLQTFEDVVLKGISAACYQMEEFHLG